MGLFSKFGKNKQESARDSGYYTSADDQGALERARSKRASSADTPRRRTSEREADDPVLPEKKRARRRLVGAIALALAVAIGLPMVLDSEPKPLASDIDISIPSKDKAADASSRAAAPVADSDSLDSKEEIVEDAKLAAATAPAAAAAHTAAKPTDRTVSGLSAQAQAHSDELDRSVAASEARAKAEADARNEQESDRKAELERRREARAKAEAKAAAEAERKLADAKAEARAKAEAERKVVEAKPAAPKPAANVAPKPAADKQAEDARALAILEGKTSKPAAADAGQKFVLQVAALSDQNKVSELRERLKQAGISSYTQKAPSGEVTRVRVGPFNSKEEAEKVRAKLVGMGLSGRLEPV